MILYRLPGDVTNKKDLERLVSEVEKKEKGIHIFVANAGISGPKTEFEGDESAQGMSSTKVCCRLRRLTVFCDEQN